MKALYPALAAVCGLFAAANSPFAQGSAAFTSATYTASGPSHSVAAADFNGDGQLDLISVDIMGTVFTNNGSGGFGIKTTLFGPAFPVGFLLLNIVPADVNGDGKPDLITSEYVLGNGALEILTNNGSGDFSSKTSLYGPPLPGGFLLVNIVAADVSGDGKPDLICSCSTNSLLVLTNDGAGVFGSNATLNVGSEPDAIAAADVNGDGKSDLICANDADNTLTVLTNDGAGDFGSNATLNVGSEPTSVVVADVNNDGKLDLIAANYGDDTLTVLTNNGTGVFGFNVTFNVGLQPKCVIATDLYGNGKLDLISANSGTNTLTVLTNNGSGLFGFNATLVVGAGPSSVAAADVNHDGKLDLVSANGDGTLTVLTQIPPPPPLTVFVPATYNAYPHPETIAVVDVNGNGKPDLISGDNLVTALTNDGSGAFSFDTTLFPPVEPVGFGALGAEAADINGDSRPDVIVPEYFMGHGVLEGFTNNGSGSFGTHFWLDLGDSHFPNHVVLSDVSGDGKPDLICTYYTNTLMVLTNDGTGAFGSNALLTVGSGPSAVAAADVNGDGKLDLISANYTDNTLTVLTNNGTGVFGSNATLNVGSEPSSVVAADINDDGKPDLISANYGDNTLTVLTNGGTGVFGFNATLDVGLEPKCVIAADLYGNGKLDLITANSGLYTLTVLTNNGYGAIGSNATLNVGFMPLAVAAADVNHDGRLDLISGNGGGTLTVLTQATIGPPVLKLTPTATNTLALSWSSFSPGFTLLTNSDLTSTNWAPAGAAISTSGGTNQSVTLLPPPSGRLFFRLRQ
jgi:FG-GAP-like repeat